ncbi:hypothetical protein AAC387_Pa09g0561 [Persea americana]
MPCGTLTIRVSPANVPELVVQQPRQDATAEATKELDNTPLFDHNPSVSSLPIHSLLPLRRQDFSSC